MHVWVIVIQSGSYRFCSIPLASTPEVGRVTESVVVEVVKAARRHRAEACGVVVSRHVAYSTVGCIAVPARSACQCLSDLGADATAHKLVLVAQVFGEFYPLSMAWCMPPYRTDALHTAGIAGRG